MWVGVHLWASLHCDAVLGSWGGMGLIRQAAHAELHCQGELACRLWSEAQSVNISFPATPLLTRCSTPWRLAVHSAPSRLTLQHGCRLPGLRHAPTPAYPHRQPPPPVAPSTLHHTSHHPSLPAPSPIAPHTGDTLFALGCGRLFEGTPATMWASLSKLLPLPDATRVFCAHEYTQSNARFAASVDPGNAALRERKERIDAARAQVGT